MPRITFIKDVPNPDGEGLLYAKGYSAEVAYSTARKWCLMGVAEEGAVIFETAAEPEPETDLVEPVKPARRRHHARVVDDHEAGNE